MKKWIGYISLALLCSCADFTPPSHYKSGEMWLDSFYLDILARSDSYTKAAEEFGNPIATEKIHDTTFAYYHYYPFLYKFAIDQDANKPKETDKLSWDFDQPLLMKLVVVNNKVIGWQLVQNLTITQHIKTLK